MMFGYSVFLLQLCLYVFVVYGYDKHCTNPFTLPYVDYISGEQYANRATEDASVSAVFYNLLPYSLDRYWDSGREDVYQGPLRPHKHDSVGTYTGHAFNFYRKGTKDFVARFVMKKGRTMYLITGSDPEILKSEEYLQLKRKESWMSSYMERTGRPWLSHFDLETGKPRGPAKHFIWPANYVGEKHTVVLSETKKEQDIMVLSVKPKVFLVPELLTPVECDLIVELARSKMKDSSLGNGVDAFKDKTRSSRTGWLARNEHPTLDKAFKKFSEVLNIPNEDLVHHDRKNPNASAENLQVVHYKEGQEYTYHWDFFDRGDSKMRCLTLLIYLNDAPDGGQNGGGTGFRRAFDGMGLQVRPPKGSAVLFYSITEDGNGDSLTEHAGLPVPVGQGEKWVSNLWVWDPAL